MSDSYAVSFEITPAAMAEAARLHQRTLLARYRILMLPITIVGLVIAFAIDPSFGFTVALFGVFMLASTWMGFADRWLVRNRARGVVGGTRRYVVDDGGVHFEDPLGSGTVPWTAITKVSANDQAIVFERDRVMAAYVPTSAFASPAERDAFLTFARQRLAVRTGSA